MSILLSIGIGNLYTEFESITNRLSMQCSGIGGFGSRGELYVAKSSMCVVLERGKANVDDLAVLPISACSIIRLAYWREGRLDVLLIGRGWKVGDKER